MIALQAPTRSSRGISSESEESDMYVGKIGSDLGFSERMNEFNVFSKEECIV